MNWKNAVIEKIRKERKMEFKLNEYGYITHYLVSGVLETGFSSSVTGDDQLVCERLMRQEVSNHNHVMPEGDIRIGGRSAAGLPWNYEYSYGNWFVDRSAFYPLLTRVEFHAATVLKAPEEMAVQAFLWSYAAVDIWVNGQYQGGIDTPVYKPIKREVLELPLKKGDNLIYFRLQNLGVRDTRSLFGLQIPGAEKERLTVTLPDAENALPYAKADSWLSGTRLKNGILRFPGRAPEGSRILYGAKAWNFAGVKDNGILEELTGENGHSLREDCPSFVLEVPVNGQILSRRFQRQELLKPVFSGVTDVQENKKRIYARIADTGRGSEEAVGRDSIYMVLARYFEGSNTEADERAIYKALDQIESRCDCSDFITCALVRFMKLYPMSQALAARCREVLLTYRYWMNEAGNDGMCFWSENHSLMFFISAYLAGEAYPDDIFVRSGMTGTELKQTARARIYDWLTETAEIGFDEFYSGGYTPITFAALLNVVDFGDEELSALAWKAADRLFLGLAIQTFQGVSIAPMGRVYGEVLYPYAQSIQSLVNLRDPGAPDFFSERLIFLAASRYQLPETDQGNRPISVVYSESNARICVEKQNDYMLTSVQSPREDGKARSWENICGHEGADLGSFAYVKSLNEWFHGTTQFEPGVFGYQQHMWYAALNPAAVVFVNHPGGSCETCSTRPGYWFGNGIMPALKQVKNVLLCIYQIPETHPIPFTHLYWPQSRFEEQRPEGNWLAGRAGGGYIGIWCSESLKPYDDQLADCEYRAEGRKTAYVCVCGSREEYPGLEEFMKACEAMNPEYDKSLDRLKTGNQELVYEVHENLTQYI